MRKVQCLFIAVLIVLPAMASSQTILNEIVKLPSFAFKYSVATSANKSTIWKLWTDVENWKEFDVLLEYSNLEPDIVFAENAKGTLKAEGAPEVSFKIQNLVDDESFIVQLQIPLFQTIQQHRYFEHDNNGLTIFTHEVEFSGGLSPFVYFFLNRIYKRETQAVVDRIKVLAENK